MRSSMLVAMALSGLLEHTGWRAKPTPISVAFDGGVYVQFAQYRKMIDQALKEQLGRLAVGVPHFSPGDFPTAITSPWDIPTVSS
jgi:hypothetical protein